MTIERNSYCIQKSPEFYPDFFVNFLTVPRMAAVAYPAWTAVSAIV